MKKFMKNVVKKILGDPHIPRFDSYKFIPSIQKALEEKNIYTPTPIQQLVIPTLMAGKSAYFTAQNGTGKTLAYGLPLMHLLKQTEAETPAQPLRPRSLIVVPSRELAMQTLEVFKGFSHFAKFRVNAIYGGDNKRIKSRELKEPIDILIGTIDRIEQHRKRKELFLSTLDFFIVDELDMLIDCSFGENILNYCDKLSKSKKSAQCVFLSSTIPNQVEEAILKMREKIPMEIIIDHNTHLHLANLTHTFEDIVKNNKMELLKKYLLATLNQKNNSVIIFCNSIKCAQAVDYFVNDCGYKATSLHGDIPQTYREHNYLAFKTKNVDILIATDIASRGLDFPHATHVVNFDFPETQSDYLHRAGRVGRAGKMGKVYSLCEKKDALIVDKLTKSIKKDSHVNITKSSFSKVNKELITADTPTFNQIKKQSQSSSFIPEKPPTPRARCSHYKKKPKPKNPSKIRRRNARNRPAASKRPSQSFQIFIWNQFGQKLKKGNGGIFQQVQQYQQHQGRRVRLRERTHCQKQCHSLGFFSFYSDLLFRYK